MSLYVGIQHNEETRTRDAHRKIVGRVVATVTRQRPRQPGWSADRDIFRIGRRSLHTRFRKDPQADDKPAGFTSAFARVALKILR